MATQKKAPAKIATKEKAKVNVKDKAKKVIVSKNSAPAARGRSKGELISHLAEKSGLARKDVGSIFQLLAETIGADLGKKGPGIFTLPGLLKLRVIQKPASKARTGINPFTGAEQTFSAKPARSVIKARPLKALKDMV